MKLEFTEDGLEAVAELALKAAPARAGSGRCSRSRCSTSCTRFRRVSEVVGRTITREVIEKKTPPILAFRGDRRRKEA